MLAEWLAEVMSGEGTEAAFARGSRRAAGAMRTDEVAAAMERIRCAAAEFIDGAGGRSGGAGPDAPLVLTDTTVRHLVACEGLAFSAASVGPVDVTWPMFRGRALGAFVEHVLFAGPVADAVTDLRSMWAASESTEDLDDLERFAPGRRGPGGTGSGGTDSAESDSAETVAEDLAELAAHAMDFSGTRRWAPRTEVPMGAGFADVLELRGRVDVLFGGPGTDLPAVLIEVKSGRIRDEHRAQLRHYILLAAVRHGEPPTGAALWSPESGLEPLHVQGVVAGSAERVAVALAALTEMVAGGDPTLTPGAHCRFCPASVDCPVATPGSTAGEAHGWIGSDAWFDDLGSGEGAW